MNIEYINKRINKEICVKTINILKDENLMKDYKKCKSVQNAIKKLETVINNHNIDENIKQKIIDDYLINLIPPGTKGVIRGNKFNKIVKNIILKLKLDESKFDICFESQHKKFKMSEIPDWYIYEKLTKKIIIGMNQLDLWNGGQQINRGTKYLIDNKMNTKKSKILCVVCNEVKFINNKNKIYKLFETGYTNDTLCYINNIKHIINDFFKLEND